MRTALPLRPVAATATKSSCVDVIVVSRRFFFCLSLLLLLLASVVSSSKEGGRRDDSGKSETNSGCDDDLVTNLPGYDRPLPSRWYSGFLRYDLEGRKVNTHYVLVEAEEDINPNNDEQMHKKKPLLYWSNGGPGASSLFGLLTELGPLQFSDRSTRTDGYRKTGIPTPMYNPKTWTRLGSLLLFDQPAPVGFSYCNEGTNSTSCGGISWDDEKASRNALLALEAFYDKFPQYGTTDLYLVGESYAGIYIPTLARRILSDSKRLPSLLKGFAVGDGCLGTETDVCGNLSGRGFDLWHVLFLAGHGQVPLSTLQEVLRKCGPGLNIEYVRSEACDAAIKKVQDEAGGFYEYSLYDDCIYENAFSSSTTHETKQEVGGGLNDYPCGGQKVMLEYLGLRDVKKALHVEHAEYFSVDNAEGFDYTPTEKDLTGFYKEIHGGGLKVLIYNGDTDPAITSLAAQVRAK